MVLSVNLKSEPEHEGLQIKPLSPVSLQNLSLLVYRELMEILFIH